MEFLNKLKWTQVQENYNRRLEAHNLLLNFHKNNEIEKFTQLCLGISHASGNYSASEHNIGYKILEQNFNPKNRIFSLAKKFLELKDPHQVPELIKSENLSYLKIGVGSELSCMMNPKKCWVANSRTIWVHLAIKHKGNINKANEELELYRDGEINSQMAYRMWSHIHGELENSMKSLLRETHDIAIRNNVEHGEETFLWADAISTSLYALEAG